MSTQTDSLTTDMKDRNNRDSEKWLERELTKFVSRNGGTAIKLVAATFTGLPDRLILWPGGVAEFVELKSIGAKQTMIQRILSQELIRQLRFRVTVIDSEIKLRQWQNSTLDRIRPN